MNGDQTTKVIAYVRVSTEEQAASGLGLDAQVAAIRAEADRRGWDVVDVIRDEGSRSTTLSRPKLHEALTRSATGEADAVVVAKLDRATRSLAGLADLIAWTDDARIGLVALDLGLDTTTSTGRLVAHIMGAVAEWERDTIAARTRAAASVRRDRGERMGRAGVRDTRPDLLERIERERSAGATWQSIADGLNRDGVATVRGGLEWRVSSVQAAGGYVRPARRAERGELPEIPRRRRAARGRG